MIKTSLKLTAVAAMLGGASVGANAATTDLGTISLGESATFSGVVQGSGTSINDIFTFNLEQGNTASGYSVISVFSPEEEWNVELSTITLRSKADGIVGNADDQTLASAIWNQGNNSKEALSFSYGSPINGPAYIQITGVTPGNDGGIGVYSGSIAAIPEPETYAMLLAGLGLMGAVVQRKSSRKTS
jgi:hypothetical protein